MPGSDSCFGTVTTPKCCVFFFLLLLLVLSLFALLREQGLLGSPQNLESLPNDVVSVLVAFVQYGAPHFQFAVNSLNAIAEWLCADGYGNQTCFDVHVLYLCNSDANITRFWFLISAKLRSRISVLVFNDSVGHMLPLQHRREFYKRRHQYDCFVYFEGDILVRRHNMVSWLQHTRRIHSSRTLSDVSPSSFAVGFVRYEQSQDMFYQGDVSFPDFSQPKFGSCSNIRGINYVALTEFPYWAGYSLTRWQLLHMLSIYEKAYFTFSGLNVHMLREEAACAPYWRFGLTKVVPANPQHFADFLVHHQPDNYPQVRHMTFNKIVMKLKRLGCS
jgi:hypothetical protein